MSKPNEQLQADEAAEIAAEVCSELVDLIIPVVNEYSTTVTERGINIQAANIGMTNAFATLIVHGIVTCVNPEAAGSITNQLCEQIKHSVAHHTDSEVVSGGASGLMIVNLDAEGDLPQQVQDMIRQAGGTGSNGH